MKADEQKLLIKVPVLVSVLAASTDYEINEVQKADAIKLAHLKSFSGDPDLKSYLDKVDKHFVENFESVVKQYAPFDDSKRKALKKEIESVNQVISTLEPDLASKLFKYLSDYSEHVKHAEHSVLERFIFPIPIKGITE
ncbi:MAG: hypothetical protein ABIT08_11730 [Bacteroidia bacterium]